MKPLMYGYIRLGGTESDEDICRIEDELRTFADIEGYCFSAIFHEFDSGDRRAFDELLEELKRSEAHYVVVPSLEHLARHQIIQNSMLARLESEARAHVLTLRNGS